MTIQTPRVQVFGRQTCTIRCCPHRQAAMPHCRTTHRGLDVRWVCAAKCMASVHVIQALRIVCLRSAKHIKPRVRHARSIAMPRLCLQICTDGRRGVIHACNCELHGGRQLSSLSAAFDCFARDHLHSSCICDVCNKLHAAHFSVDMKTGNWEVSCRRYPAHQRGCLHSHSS
jgi:hypothetical protein